MKFTFIDRFMDCEERMSKIEKRQKAIEDSVWSMNLDIRGFRDTQSAVKTAVEVVEFTVKNSQVTITDMLQQFDLYKKQMDELKQDILNKLKLLNKKNASSNKKQPNKKENKKENEEEIEEEEEEEEEEENEEEEEEEEENEEEEEEEEEERESIEDVEDEYRESQINRNYGDEIDEIREQLKKLQEEHKESIEEIQTEMEETRDEQNELLEGIVERLNALIKNYKTLTTSFRR